MIKKRLKLSNIFLPLLMICCLAGLTYSILNIIKWKLDSNKTNHQINQIQDKVLIEEINDNESTQVIEPDKKIDKTNPYWDYIKMNLIDVDFNKLKSINKDVKGWIQVNGTNINYPFVQTKDNKYYLTHSFNKSYNDAGWVFLDYRNNISELDKNTIIYAHGRLDNTMFGSLRNILTSKWLDNSSNYVVKLATESESTLWQVFSIYHIPSTSDYLEIKFNNNRNFSGFTSMLLKRSSHRFNTTVNDTDKILTLSTCYNDNDRVVLHAKLIKYEKKVIINKNSI